MTTEIDWRVLLAKAVDDNPRGKAGVSVRLGVSRELVSRVMSKGKSAITPSTDFINRVIKRFHTVECLINGEAVAITECMKAINPAPTHNPIAMYRWRACQQCPKKPAAKENA